MLQCKLRIIVLSAVLVFSAQSAILLAWPEDPTVNVSICRAPGQQSHQVMVSDGEGGAIIAWEDERTGDYFYDIYAQQVDTNGEVQWTENGILLCPEPGGQRGLRMVSDGVSGAIVVWEDFRSESGWDIRAQRVDASGILQWAEDGVPICIASSDQMSPSAVSDGQGGAIIVWQDARNSTGIYSADDIYAQRVNANGEVQWTEDGVSICTAPNSQVAPSMVSDGEGGATIAWRDYRSGNHIYMHRVNANGVVQWRENGVLICTASGADQPPIVRDRERGVIVAWTDFRNNRWDIYAQRVDASGVLQWPENGVMIGKGAGQHPVLVSDGVGGAIITWEVYRNHSLDVLVQHINASGVVQWSENGVLICPAADDNPNDLPSLVNDGSGGAIITWGDNRSGYDIYAQRMNASGIVLWTEKGVPICMEPHSQGGTALVSDAGGGAIITWEDWRSDNKDIYAQKVFSDGSLSGPVSSSEIELPLHVPSRFALFQSIPNPFNPSTAITYELPRATHVTLSVSTLTGQRVATLVSAYQEAGHYEVKWDGSGFANGIYLYRLETEGFVETKRMVLIK